MRNRWVLWDWDGCAATVRGQEGSGELLRQEIEEEDADRMDDYIKKILPPPTQTELTTRILSFSLRAINADIELNNGSRNGTLMCHKKHGLEEIAQKFGFQIEQHLLADTLGQVPSGTTYGLLAQCYGDLSRGITNMLKEQTQIRCPNRKKALKKALSIKLNNLWDEAINKSGVTYNTARKKISDIGKGILLLDCVLFAANEKTNEGESNLHFIDDKRGILESLYVLVAYHPHILPKQTTVSFHELHPTTTTKDCFTQQIGETIRGTGQSLRSIGVDHKDVIRRIADLALSNKQIDRKSWVSENRGAMFCKIYDEALTQIKQEAIIYLHDPRLWRPKAWLSFCALSSSQVSPKSTKEHDSLFDAESTFMLLWCNGRVPHNPQTKPEINQSQSSTITVEERLDQRYRMSI